jgi:microcystin-dependent protein
MDPIIGQIMLFAGNYPPQGWAFCEGQLLAISSNAALFSILGTTYGGDGEVTFGLPDFRGRFPMHHGTGPGLGSHSIGQQGGTETHTQSPVHDHPVSIPASSGEGETGQPGGAVPAAAEFPTLPNGPTADTTMQAFNTASAGVGSVSHVNPYLNVSFCIALQGIFPSRN